MATSSLESFPYADLLGPDLIAQETMLGTTTLHVFPGAIVRVLTILRDDSRCLFKVLVDICGVDYPDRSSRFEVVYHLLSVERNERVRLKVSVPEGGAIPSCTEVFSAANWYEREVWDLYGIPFTGHPDLRRLLTDYQFEGHPLRKDFPLSGYTEVRYDDTEKRVVYEPVTLTQDYRSFDFLSPWEGMTPYLKGEEPQPPRPLLDDKEEA